MIDLNSIVQGKDFKKILPINNIYLGSNEQTLLVLGLKLLEQHEGSDCKNEIRKLIKKLHAKGSMNNKRK